MVYFTHSPSEASYEHGDHLGVHIEIPFLEGAVLLGPC